MAWIRRNNTYYYYRSKKRGGRVVQEYVGAGVIGALAWAEDERDREARRAEAEGWRSEREELERGDREFLGIFGAVEALARLALERAGYRRHARGQWRKRRRPVGEVVAESKGPYVGQPRRRPRPDEERRAIVEVLDRAKAGDASAMPEVRRLLDEDPERMLWVCGGEVQQYAGKVLIGFLAGPTNLMTAEAMERKISALRAELAGPYPSALERLLAERAASCWLDCHRRDWQCASLEKEGTTFEKLAYFDKLRHRAHARYLSALKALALVRKLEITTIQVNVDRLTVEAAGPG